MAFSLVWPQWHHVTLQVVRTIPAGGEATASYLGELVLAPLKWRREWLHGSYGFTCECERCKVGTARDGLGTATDSSLHTQQRTVQASY